MADISDFLTYNKSEYTINGKTYRNLEAQVGENKRLSEEAYKTATELESDVNALETTVSALGKTVKTATIYVTTFNEIRQWVDSGYIVIASTRVIPTIPNGIDFVLTLCDSTKAEFSAVGESSVAIATVDTNDTWTLNTIPIGSGDVEWAVYNETYYSTVSQWWTDGKMVLMKQGGVLYFLTACGGSPAQALFTHFRMTNTSQAVIRHITLYSENNEWELGGQLQTSSTLTPNSDRQIPTSKAVADYVAQHSGSSVAIVTLTYDSVQGEYTADKTYSEINDIIDAEEDVLLIYNYQYYRFNRFRSTDSSYGYPLVFTCADGFPYSGKIDTFYVENTDEWYHHTLTVDPIATSTSILSGDRVMVGRAVDPDDTRTVGTLAFDTSVTDKFLCQDGTWKSMTLPVNYVPLSTALPLESLPAITITTEVNP